MKEKEILAYAITHAPKGVKGGPYEGLGDYGSPASSLRHAERWKAPLSPYSYTLARVRQVHPHARVIRIVRKARPFKETIPVCGTCGYDAHGGRDEESEPAPSPSEASAVEVLRELARVGTTLAGKTPLPKEDIRVSLECFADEVRDVRTALDRARRVLAASGPDPMPVVRAAMRYLDHGPDGRLGPAWVGFREACEAYREAGEPGTLAHLRNDLRDAEKRAETAERELVEVREAAFDQDSGPGEAPTPLEAVANLRSRAETAERERDDLLGAHRSALAEQTARADTNFRAALKVQGDMTDLRAALAHAQAERDTARAKLARLTAPAEGEPSGADLRALVDREGLRIGVDAALVAVWRAGVAHERARHGEPRATDEDLVGVYTHGYDAQACQTRDPFAKSHGDCRRAAVSAVAARVRQERCLVAQAVGANVDIRVCEDDGGGFMVGVHAPGCDEELTRYVPPADVPATLARLLGEVAK